MCQSSLHQLSCQCQSRLNSLLRTLRIWMMMPMRWFQLREFAVKMGPKMMLLNPRNCSRLRLLLDYFSSCPFHSHFSLNSHTFPQLKFVSENSLQICRETRFVPEPYNAHSLTVDPLP